MCRPWTGAAAALLLMAGCGSPDDPRPPATQAGVSPSFDDYLAPEVFTGRPAPVDLESHPRAPRFRTMLRESAAGGVNFAGHYAVAVWGCGTMCQEFMIVDLRTGRVHEGGMTSLGLEHRPDSRLLVLNPPERVAEGDCAPGACTTQYLEWIGTRLEPILDPGEREAIVRAADEYTRRHGVVDDFTVDIHAVADGHARGRVTAAAAATDPATVYLRRDAGGWRGIAIGTAFPPEDLDGLQVPWSVRPWP